MFSLGVMPFIYFTLFSFFLSKTCLIDIFKQLHEVKYFFTITLILKYNLRWVNNMKCLSCYQTNDSAWLFLCVKL